jgi:membrane-associated phospholipid phosphatase
MDYRLYHAVNQFVFHHGWIGQSLSVVENWAVPVVAVATVALWLVARPGSSRKWKLACGSALGSAALALLINRLIARVWNRARPFASHRSAHVWGSRSHDPSFPSDHASAAFGIAFAVFLYDRLVGSIFLAAAFLIGVGRVFTRLTCSPAASSVSARPSSSLVWPGRCWSALYASPSA